MFCGISEKNSRNFVLDEIDIQTFKNQLNTLLDTDNEDYEEKLSYIFSEKRRCELFCKKLGMNREEFIKTLVIAQIPWIFKAKNILKIKKIQYPELFLKKKQ